MTGFVAQKDIVHPEVNVSMRRGKGASGAASDSGRQAEICLLLRRFTEVSWLLTLAGAAHDVALDWLLRERTPFAPSHWRYLVERSQRRGIWTRNVSRVALHHPLGALSGRERAALVLLEFVGLPANTVAAALEMSYGALVQAHDSALSRLLLGRIVEPDLTRPIELGRTEVGRKLENMLPLQLLIPTIADLESRLRIRTRRLYAVAAVVYVSVLGLVLCTAYLISQARL